MAFPTVRAVGTIASSTTTISPGLPTGTTAGDLLLMFLETNNTTVTCSGWSEHPGSPVSTAVLNNETRLTVLYKIAAGGDATTTNDPGNHVIGRIIGITAGTFDIDAPFGEYATNTEATSDTSGVIPGTTTSRPDVLVVAACTGSTDGTNITTEFSSWTNANLGSLTERIDNRRADGNGGLLGVATGTYTGPGAYGNTTVTYFDNSHKALMSLTINSPRIPQLVVPSGLGARA